jgi:hypothetical protein
MSSIAPNLSLVVGSETAAKLMGLAGGLHALSGMPACNIQVGGCAGWELGLCAVAEERSPCLALGQRAARASHPACTAKATSLSSLAIKPIIAGAGSQKKAAVGLFCHNGAAPPGRLVVGRGHHMAEAVSGGPKHPVHCVRVARITGELWLCACPKPAAVRAVSALCWVVRLAPNTGACFLQCAAVALMPEVAAGVVPMSTFFASCLLVIEFDQFVFACAHWFGCSLLHTSASCCACQRNS